MLVPIVAYILQWNPHTNQGNVVIKAPNGEERRLNVETAEEFTAIATILNESPVFFNTDHGFITTQWEQVGGA